MASAYCPAFRKMPFLSKMNADLALAWWWVDTWKMSVMERPSKLPLVKGTSFGTLLVHR